MSDRIKMPDRITIRSAFREYYAEFVGNFTVPLKNEIGVGGVLIVDSGVFDIYRTRIKDALEGKECIILEASEQNKTIGKSKELIEKLVERGVRRNQKLIAVGGGVIQDIVGFAASILYRGVPWVFFPTTLLAQADSCIGSKTSINLGGKKNLVGTFYPPAHIYIDTAFLDSLSVDDVKSGIGEMLHFYLYAGGPYADKVIAQYETLIKDRTLFSAYIAESLAIKKSVVEIDEFDKGERNKFNYGHTFGHALESVTDYGIKHGQAVTVGMDIANFLSWKEGLMNESVFKNLHKLLAVNFPTYPLKNINLERYMNALAKDKKNIGANIGCILAEGPGRLIKKQIPADENVKALIQEYFSRVEGPGESAGKHIHADADFRTWQR